MVRLVFSFFDYLRRNLKIQQFPFSFGLVKGRAAEPPFFEIAVAVTF